MLFTFDDIKMMYDWGYFTDEQVHEFVPTCITIEQFHEITEKTYHENES